MINRFEQFTFSIFEISKYWHKLAADEMEKHGLKGSHCTYLLALARAADGLTAPQLCDICGRDKSDVSRMMRIMEQEGLVMKESAYQNRYGGVFKLTPDGINAAEQVRETVRQAVEIAGKDLTEENRRIFYDSLESIVNNLRKLSKEGFPEK